MRKRKDSPYFHFSKEKESHDKGVKKIQKSHTLAHPRSKCMTCISFRSGFWLSNIMWCKYAFLSSLPWAPHTSFVQVGWKERQLPKAFGEEYTHLSDREYHTRNLLCFQNKFKTSGKKVDQRMNAQWFCENRSTLQPPKTWRSNKPHRWRDNKRVDRMPTYENQGWKFLL